MGTAVWPERDSGLVSPDMFDVRRRRGATPPEGWHAWVTTLFPNHVPSKFAQRHADMWQWAEAIEPGKAPGPAFVAIWPRGGAKSSSAELVCTYLACEGKRSYGWYIRATQENADKSVQNIARLLESSQVELYYPQHSQRAITKFGSSQSWRGNRLKTAGGFTLDAIGLDTAARGMKDEEDRPDFIIIDDVDEKHDSPQATAKKIETLTTSLLPAMAKHGAVLPVQNLIIGDGFFARMVTGEADYLSNRIVSGPHPAVRGLKTEVVELADGGRRHMIVGGKATWAGQSLEDCQKLLDDIGLSAFLKECQHDVFGKAEGVALNKFEDRHVEDLTEPQAFKLLEAAKRSRNTMGIVGGVDFSYWRFAFLLYCADTSGRLHEIAEWFSQKESLETRAKGIDAILTHYDIPIGVPIWADAANPTDILELNLALDRIKSKYRVIAVGMENKLRIASVERMNDLLDRDCLLYRRDVVTTTANILAKVNWQTKRGAAPIMKSPKDFMTWQLGMNAAGSGVETKGSRLRWEVKKWRYPVPKPGEAQGRDPDDNTADGADLIAAKRYSVMSWWQATQAPVQGKRGEDHDQTRIQNGAPVTRQPDQGDPLWKQFEEAHAPRKGSARRQTKTIEV